jgi:hypothetical protein
MASRRPIAHRKSRRGGSRLTIDRISTACGARPVALAVCIGWSGEIHRKAGRREVWDSVKRRRPFLRVISRITNKPTGKPVSLR